MARLLGEAQSSDPPAGGDQDAERPRDPNAEG
jgi:hypothetical protein